MMKRKRLMLVPAGAIAGVLVFAAVAYACTITRGQTKVFSATRAAGSNSCGAALDCAAPGDVLNVGTDPTQTAPHRIDGQGNTIQYYLYMLNYQYIDDGMACMSKDAGTGVGRSVPMLIGGPTTVSASTNHMIPVDGTVPAALPTDGTQSQLGKALVCFMGAGSGGNTLNNTTSPVTTRVAHMWGTLPASLRIVAI